LPGHAGDVGCEIKILKLALEIIGEEPKTGKRIPTILVPLVCRHQKPTVVRRLTPHY